MNDKYYLPKKRDYMVNVEKFLDWYSDITLCDFFDAQSLLNEVEDECVKQGDNYFDVSGSRTKSKCTEQYKLKVIVHAYINGAITQDYDNADVYKKVYIF